MRVKRGVRLASVVAALASAAAAWAPRPAHAHPEVSAAGSNRYVTAAVAGGRVELADTWLLGTLAAVEERRRLDSDGDGQLSREEIEHAQAARGAEPPAVRVRLDGVDQEPPSRVYIDLGGDLGAAGAPLVIERRMTLGLAPAIRPGATHTLIVELGAEPPRLLETEVMVDLEPGLVLVAPSRDRLGFKGPRRSALEQRSVTFTFAAPAAPRSARRWFGLAAGVVVLAGLLVAAAGRRLARAARS
jgi:hypothetical protein